MTSKTFTYSMYLVALTLAGCSPAIRKFSEKRVESPDFYKDIISTDAELNYTEAICCVDSFTVYQANFEDAIVESNGLLDFTSVPKESDSTVYKLLNNSEYSQVNLIQFNKNIYENAFIYFLARYRIDNNEDGSDTTKCIGFGPVYFGVTNKTKQGEEIRFARAFRVKDGNGDSFLKMKTKPSLKYFVLKKILKKEGNLNHLR